MIKIPRKVNNGIIELCDATPSKKGKIIVSKNNIAKSQQFVPIDLKEENLGGLPSTSIQGYDIGSNRVITNSTTILNELGKELLIASRKGDIDGIKHLLTKGAPFSADWLGTSPLHLAAQNNHVAVCEILLRAGISIDARTKVDRTPLHMAAYEGYLDIVNLLIENQADINCKDLLGMTPLHWAVQNGHYEVMEFLITNGADINVPNKFTLTPADIAAQINRDDMIEFINSYTNDSTIAAQNLVLELQGDNCEDNDPLEVENTEDDPEVLPSVEPIFISTSSYGSNAENTINLEEEQATLFAPSITISSSDSECVEEDSLSQQIPTSEENGVCDSAVKLLQEHGITMIQADSEETNILNAVMESGHSVVLTDIGKEVLNSVKQSEEEAQVQTKRIITVTPEEFLAMTNNISKKPSNNSNKIRILPTKQGIKRIIMKKNRGVPFTNNISNVLSNKQEPIRSQKTEVEQIMSQLIEAKKTIEEYKIKLKQKEQEAERYKMQLKLLLDS